MGYGLKLLFFFCFVSFVYAVGILLFTRGFLLKRLVIDEYSECTGELRSDLLKSNNKSEGCWMRRRYQKAVILIIDALRYDFALYDASLGENETLPYQNKLKVIHEVLENSPQHGALFRFVADPPTTTMQRLKGLTTGSLPTFVDAGSNFASSKITEDNIISQLHSLQKNITFMGDDTWESLFPDSFQKSLPFPSFNVKDLHTVDNGVIRHLVPELNSKEWDVLIGHFLGVDHCGHKYGPYHPAMATKLTQMDAVIRSVIEVLDEDTVLFVMGDHGMTRTGDHGGDSDDEVDAALFVYSAKPLNTCHNKRETITTVSQIDLVPTISLLLGNPIPFGNLGSIIPDLLCQGPATDTAQAQATHRDSTNSEVLQQVVGQIHRTAAFELNAAQVHKYLTKYASITGEISQTKLVELEKILNNATAHTTNMKHLVNNYGSYDEMLKQATDSELSRFFEGLSTADTMYSDFLFQVKSLCQTLWAKFDLVSSFVGILVLSLNICVVLLLLCDVSRLASHLTTVVQCTVLVSVLGLVIAFVATPEDLDPSFSLAVCVAAGLLLGFFVSLLKSTFNSTAKGSSVILLCKPSADSVLAIVFCFLQGASVFSNSFIVNEDKQVAFFIQALVTVKCVQALWKCGPQRERSKPLLRLSQSSKKSKKEQRSSVLTGVFLRLLLAWIIFGIINRTALIFKACREEQWSCKPSDFLKPLSALTGEYSTANNRFLLTVLCVGSIPLALRQWMAYQGNLNGTSAGVVCVKFVVPVVFLLVCAHWALQIAPEGMTQTFPKVLEWQQITLPRMVYCLCVLTVACLVYSPLCVYTVYRSRKSSLSEKIQTLQGPEDNSKIIHVLFNEIKQKWGEKGKERSAVEDGSKDDHENAPMVYGLATVYSSSCLVLFLAVVLPVTMVLGDGVTVAVFLMTVQMFLLLEMHGMFRDLEPNTSDARSSGPSWSTVALWSFLATHYFYCTGHQATIPSIRFEAAFVGFPGDMKNLVLPGLLIILNTFSGPVLSAVSLPLLLFWPRIPNRLFGPGNKGGPQSDKGEFDWSENPEQLRNQLLRLVLMYQALHGTKLLATCCSAVLHRRHLMVWKIFAPRFVFEGVSFLVTSVVLVTSFLAVLRVDLSLGNWIKKLETSDESRTKTK